MQQNALPLYRKHSQVLLGAKTCAPHQRECKVWKSGSYVNPLKSCKDDSLRPQDACQWLATQPQVLYCRRKRATVHANIMEASEFMGRCAKLSLTVVVAVVASTTSATTSMLAMVKLGSTACS
mmetsp:Transcript_60778/g.112767  ORF Transcript_60778/g.112767 Transcript_60778/m.112767 type:complete len:123 (+) Transcript_60778:187-555(+)